VVHATGQHIVAVYASWNGATDVARWRVLGFGSSGTAVPVATALRSGFETVITVNYPKYSRWQVEALAADGTVLGRSAQVRTQ
jgi:hypothetical protein